MLPLFACIRKHMHTTAHALLSFVSAQAFAEGEQKIEALRAERAALEAQTEAKKKESEEKHLEAERKQLEADQAATDTAKQELEDLKSFVGETMKIFFEV